MSPKYISKEMSSPLERTRFRISSLPSKPFKVLPRSKKGRNKDPINTVKMVDGLLNLRVNVLEGTCQSCKSSLEYPCPHILYLLSIHYGLPDIVIAYYHKPEVLVHIVNIVMKEKVSAEEVYQAEDTLHEYFKELECPICMDTLYHPKKELHLYHCEQCSNPAHMHCMSKWISRDKGCTVCRNGDKTPPPETT